jgi:dihydrofolate synthase/folylpolyglutamate synthase
MNSESALNFINDPRWQASKPGLERTRALLDALKHPERELKFVHVVGTNGKGSTSACIASCLSKAGYRTGLYISPYVLCFNELIQVDGRYISDAELDELVDEIRPAAEAMADSPTEFELITAMALLYYKRRNCDIVVLEAGMGGTMDATNVIGAPEAAVICAISYDHCQWLGSTLTEIAEVKSGIIKKGCDTAIYGSGDEADSVVEKKCAETDSRLFKADFSQLKLKSSGLQGCVFDYGRLKDIRLPLAGTYQPKNAALAVTALDILRLRGWNIPDSAIIDGLCSVCWPGRYEVLRHNPTVILDGSHNPHGMEATADSLKKHFGGRKITFIIGVMADKDIGGMMKFLQPMAERFITVEPPNPRAMKADRLAELLSAYGVPAFPYGTIEEGVKAALELSGADGAVVAIGSLYFSGEIRAAVKKLSTDNRVEIKLPALSAR